MASPAAADGAPRRSGRSTTSRRCLARRRSRARARRGSPTSAIVARSRHRVLPRRGGAVARVGRRGPRAASRAGALGRPLCVGVSRKSFIGAHHGPRRTRPSGWPARSPPPRSPCCDGARHDPHPRRGRDRRRRARGRAASPARAGHDAASVPRGLPAGATPRHRCWSPSSLYRVLVMFRGTRAVQMLVGLGVPGGRARSLARRIELHSARAGSSTSSGRSG